MSRDTEVVYLKTYSDGKWINLIIHEGCFPKTIEDIPIEE